MKKYIVALLLIAFVYNIFLLLPNGVSQCIKNVCGLAMVDTYFHDAFYHMALASAAFQTSPFQLPIFGGSLMQGYHYLYDFLLYLLSFTGIPINALYWRVTPLIYFGVISWLLIKFSRRIHSSPLFTLLLLFLFFFGGTASYVATFRNTGSFFGDGVSSLLHTSTLILYPTVGYSLILFTAVLILLTERHKPKNYPLIMGILVFFGMGMKFYAGLLMIIMIGIVEAYTGWKERKYLRTIGREFLYVSCFFIALVVFYRFPQALGTEPVFGYAPLATVHQVIEDPHMYPIEGLAVVRQILERDGLGPRLLAIETFVSVLYIIHHYGTRILGFGYLLWLIYRRKATVLDVAAAIVIIVATAASMLLVQRGDQWWNTLQFLYYGAFLLTIYTARWLYALSRKKKPWAWILVVVICLLSIPDSVEKMHELYITSKRIVPVAELEGLAYLRKQSSGMVMSVPLLPDTAYISALSGKTVYYADEQMLRNNGIDFASRKEKLSHIPELDLNSIDSRYLYLVKNDPQYAVIHEKALGTSFRKIYENKGVLIMKRDR